MNYTKELIPSWFKTESGNEFEIRPLSGFEYMRILPHIQGGRMTEEGIQIALRNGVLNWKADTEFNSESISNLYLMDMTDLAQEIMKLTEASEDKIKN